MWKQHIHSNYSVDSNIFIKPLVLTWPVLLSPTKLQTKHLQTKLQLLLQMWIAWVVILCHKDRSTWEGDLIVIQEEALDLVGRVSGVKAEGETSLEKRGQIPLWLHAILLRIQQCILQSPKLSQPGPVPEVVALVTKGKGEGHGEIGLGTLDTKLLFAKTDTEKAPPKILVSYPFGTSNHAQPFSVLSASRHSNLPHNL